MGPLVVRRVSITPTHPPATGFAGVHARAAAPSTGPAKAASATTLADKLGSHDRGLLATARSKGDRRVTLILATVRGQTASVAASVRANGGFTSTTNDRIGYVRAALPTSSVERITGLSRVLAVDRDESIPLPDPSVARSDAAGAVAAVAAPGRPPPVRRWGAAQAPVTIHRSVRTRSHISVPRTDMKAVKAIHSHTTAFTSPRVVPPSSSQSPARCTPRMTGR